MFVEISHTNQFSNSPDANWVSYNQCSSDTNPSDLAQTYSLKAQSSKTAPTSDASLESQRATCTSN